MAATEKVTELVERCVEGVSSMVPSLELFVLRRRYHLNIFCVSLPSCPLVGEHIVQIIVFATVGHVHEEITPKHYVSSANEISTGVTGFVQR
jgi:hypothetical protein